MNYNALLLLDKHHKLKKDYSTILLNNNQFTHNKEKYNKYINIRTKNKQKSQTMEKCYSVKPCSYIIPRDVILRDIFQQSMKTYKIKSKNDLNTNENNNNRKQILGRIKKIIFDKQIYYDIYIKTIYLYDLLLLKKENIAIKIKNKFEKFRAAPNILIALTAFFLILKFNYVENKMIKAKKILKVFDDLDITLDELHEMEVLALKLIDYELTFQTPYSFMELFLMNGIIFNEDYLQSDSSFIIYELAIETVENIMENSNEYFKYNYFYLCCSIVSYVREKFKINKWPKIFEINFGIKFDEFVDVYNIFFPKNSEKVENNKSCKKNVRYFYNSDFINIKNLKSINNIINVLKIMKSADKVKRVKEKYNRIDLFTNFNNNENLNENHQQHINDNINTNSNSQNKRKVGLKKNFTLISYKSPEKTKRTRTKTLVSSLISKFNGENINKITSLYIHRNEKKLSENKYIKEKSIEDKGKDNKYNISNSSCNDESEKEEINELETITKSILPKSYNKHKKNIYFKNRNNQIFNKSFNPYYKSNLDTTYSTNLRLKFFNIKNRNKDIKANNLNNSNINNSYNKSNLNLNNFDNKEKISNYNRKFTEKKLNKELLNSELNKKQKMFFYSNNNSSNLNQTSSEEFHFYRHKPNIKQENPEINNISKNKEENSDFPTCESSDPKLSFNDFSIRKTYGNIKNSDLGINNGIEENKKGEKDLKKCIDKNKIYNKLKNTKISFADSSFSRKMGLRKFYKQKNLVENK